MVYVAWRPVKEVNIFTASDLSGYVTKQLIQNNRSSGNKPLIGCFCIAFPFKVFIPDQKLPVMMTIKSECLELKEGIVVFKYSGVINNY